MDTTLPKEQTPLGQAAGESGGAWMEEGTADKKEVRNIFFYYHSPQLQPDTLYLLPASFYGLSSWCLNPEWCPDLLLGPSLVETVLDRSFNH